MITFGPFIGSAQDCLELDQLKFLDKSDTLIVDIDYKGNRHNAGDRFLIFCGDTSYTLIHFRNYHSLIYVDGIQLTDSETQDYLLKNINDQNASSSVTINQITPMQFEDIVTELELLVNSERAEEINYYEFDMAKRSYLTIKLNDLLLCKMYNGWIEINKN